MIDNKVLYRYKSDFSYPNFKINTDTNKKTVAFVGDSATMSFGASETKTYPLVFEKLYNRQGVNPLSFVYNFGIPGYGPDQEYVLMTSHIIPIYKPDVIVWNINVNDLYDGNDECLFVKKESKWIQLPASRNIAYFKGWLNAHMPRFIVWSNIYNFLWKFFYIHITKDNGIDLFTFGCTKVTTTYQEISKTKEVVAEKLLYLINELRSSYSGKLIITIIPYQKYFDFESDYNSLDSSYDLILNTVKTSGVSYVDFNESILRQISPDFLKYKRVYDQADMILPTFDLSDNPSQKYFLTSETDRAPYSWRHPNQLLYDLMSSTLAQFMEINHL